MLLRRLSEGLKSQHWTSVYLDLLIVILGIFLGLQVSQWYEGRQEIGLEKSILQRLQVEFDAISAEAVTAIRFHQEEIIALELIQQSLQKGRLAPSDEVRFRGGLQNAMSYDLGPSRSGTYIGTLSSGHFRLLRNQELRSALSVYDDSVSKAELLFSNFQQNQRKHETVFNRHLVRDPAQEQKFDTMPTGVIFVHGKIAEFEFDAMADDDEFLYAIGRLIEYHINFQFWHINISRSANLVLSLLESNKS